MSARATNEWKVGAFVVGCVVLLIATIFWLGASRFDQEVFHRVTYFDESVQGLDVGAPVKIRGVTIGKVTEIGLAPDHRLVEVRAAIQVASLLRINAIDARENIDPAQTSASPEMRIRVASQGITGIKFLEADFYAPDSPQLELSFEAPDDYIPSAPSTLKSLEGAIVGIGDEFPPAIREIRSAVATLDQRLSDLDTARLSTAIVELADELRGVLDGSSKEGIGADLRALVGDLRRTNGLLAKTISELSAPGGSIDRVAVSFESVATDFGAAVERLDAVLADADLSATTAAIGGAARSTERLATDLRPVADEMSGTLADLRRTLRRVEALAELLERDPGALLRGRTEPDKR